ncbi:MAG: type I-F CRISPR-associated protein Cas7f/Csy3 [Hafnia sp.]
MSTAEKDLKKTTSKKTKVLKTLPEKLTVCGAISTSHAVFFSQHDNDPLRPVTLGNFNGVGTMASYEHQFGKTPRDDVAMGYSNPYSSDVAHLPHGCDTLVANFSVSIDKATNNYHSCSDAAFATKLSIIAQTLFDSVGGTELAKLYVDNLLTGTWLFRNRKAIRKTISIEAAGVKSTGEAFLTHHEFDIKNRNNVFEGDSYELLVEYVRQAFADKLESRLVLKCSMLAVIGNGAHLYPSQLWPDPNNKAMEGRKNLFVACKNTGATGLTNVKVGNGLRTVDKWHGAGDFSIPVNPYGHFREGSCILRSRAKGNDFYTLLARTVDDFEQTLETIHNAKSADDIPGDLYFVTSNLIRGGVFNATSKDDDKDKDQEHE